tara:strand:+ start:1014 stop:1724 length:711 start_codon:yes stop_codon:yes gene_type:complete
MCKTYADTVRLLLTVAPEVFANDIFAMKDGTAINLFLRDMPRLSVDIDVVYLPREKSRDEALRDVNQQLAAISERIFKLGLHARLIPARNLGDTKLIVESETSQVKIEVNVVFRGSVLPPERRPLSASTSDRFSVEFDLPVLAPDELYGSKLVAALDRQHPRDLFDVWQLYESGGITEGMIGLARAEPDWSLLMCRHAQKLPALRWKLSNLETFRKRRPEDFEAQARALESGLGQV